MPSLLEGLGYAAGGLAQGLERGQGIRMRNMAMEQQQRQMEQQAAIEADMRAADEAARAAVQQMRAQHDQQYTGLGAHMTRGGSDGSLAGGDAAQDAVSQPVPAFQPSKRQMLAVSEARTNELLKRGRTDQAMKLWTQDEGMRQQLRQEAAQQGLARFKTSGDPTELLKGVYENIDDGWDIGNVIQGPETQDGVKIFGIERVNQATGEKRTDEVRSDEIEGLVMQALDPMGAAKYSWQSKLEAFKAKQARQTNEARHKQTLAEIEARGDNQRDVQELKNEGMLEGKRIQINGTISAAQIRAASRGSGSSGGGRGGGASGVQSKQVLDDGRVMLIMRDGTNRIMTDDSGKAVRGIDAERLLAGVTRDISKTLDGSLANYPTNRQTAVNTLPKPPTARPSLDQFVRPAPGQPAQKPAQRPPLDAFIR